MNLDELRNMNTRIKGLVWKNGNQFNKMKIF